MGLRRLILEAVGPSYGLAFPPWRRHWPKPSASCQVPQVFNNTVLRPGAADGSDVALGPGQTLPVVNDHLAHIRMFDL